MGGDQPSLKQGTLQSESAAPALVVIACGALARELRAIIETNGLDGVKIACLPAKLHNRPQLIPEAVRRKIRVLRPLGAPIFCAYGDCGHRRPARRGARRRKASSGFPAPIATPSTPASTPSTPCMMTSPAPSTSPISSSGISGGCWWRALASTGIRNCSTTTSATTAASIYLAQAPTPASMAQAEEAARVPPPAARSARDRLRPPRERSPEAGRLTWPRSPSSTGATSRPRWSPAPAARRAPRPSCRNASWRRSTRPRCAPASSTPTTT